MLKTEAKKYDPPDLKEEEGHSDSSVSSCIHQDDVERDEGSNSASFSVQGLYTRYYPTPEEEETMERQFICCRRRMNTRPFKNSSSNDSMEEIDDDGDNTSKEIGKGKACDDNESDEDEEYETAMFVPEVGLVGPQFWHEYDDESKIVREDRAVLFQSQENYEKLISFKRFKSCFEDIDYMENPTFGEQVIVNDIKTSELAIGDVFEIEGGHSPLVIEITAPRKPCIEMDKKNGTPYGKKGIKHYSHHNILAGWFARVLVAGGLREGMKFIRTKHPNPKWTLNYIHNALYGEGNHFESLMNASSWKRDRKELEELIALPQLGEYEWKVEGRKQLLKLDGVDWKKVRKNLIDPQAKVPDYFLEFFRANLILETLTAALKYFGIL